MFASKLLVLVLAFATSSVLAGPIPGINISNAVEVRASTNINPAAVKGTTCGNIAAKIDFHDENVAQLQICGGIAGAITKCGGAPTSTTGSSGTALFKLKGTVSGATINVSKGRWEGCIRAARAVCPKGEFTSTCVGGASAGDVAFSLSAQ